MEMQARRQGEKEPAGECRAGGGPPRGTDCFPAEGGVTLSLPPPLQSQKTPSVPQGLCRSPVHSGSSDSPWMSASAQGPCGQPPIYKMDLEPAYSSPARRAVIACPLTHGSRACLSLGDAPGPCCFSLETLCDPVSADTLDFPLTMPQLSVHRPKLFLSSESMLFPPTGMPFPPCCA